MNYQDIVEDLKKNLTSRRFIHSQGVSAAAVDLAIRYSVDCDKARLAGILHDCAREIPTDSLIIEVTKRNIKVCQVERLEPVLLHAPLGAILAREKYGVYDTEILSAIETHTVGGPMMDDLAKIIYLADFIEPNRTFHGVDELRLIAQEDLDKAVLAAYDHTIAYIIKKGGLIHPATIEGRNYIISSTKLRRDLSN